MPRPAAIDSAPRLQALLRYGVLDTPPEEAFDRLTRIGARLLQAPMCLVTLLDERRQFFKSFVGLPEPWASRQEAPLPQSFCRHVVLCGAPVIVTDAAVDPRVRGTGVIEAFGARSYVGVPLVSSDGQVLGALCALDTRPRVWTQEDLESLQDLAGAAMTELELRAAREPVEAPEPSLRGAASVPLIDPLQEGGGRAPSAIDAEELLSLVDQDPLLLRELVESADSSLLGALSTLRDAVAEGDLATVAEVTHRVRGTLAYLAAPQALRLAVQLGQAARAGSPHLEGILADLEREVGQVRAECAALLDTALSRA